MNYGQLSIGQPWVLAGLGVCVLLVVTAWRSRVLTSPRMRVAILFTRVLSAGLLVVALADTRWMLPSRRLAVATIVDDAPTVTGVERNDTRRRLAALRGRNPDVTFVDLPAHASRRAGTIAAQITMATALLPTDRARRIVLATDGREPGEELAAAIDHARRQHIEVSLLPMGDRPPVDQVAVQAIEGPRLVRAGQPTTIGVRLFSVSRRNVHLQLFRDALPLAQIDVQAPPGSSVHDMNLEFPDEGLHELQIEATPDTDTVPLNNRFRSLVRVVSPPRVLLVNELPGNNPVLATVFRDSRLRVDAVSVARMPDDLQSIDQYQLVVLDEIVEENLSEAQQRALRTWVEQRGGGLITISGTHATRRDPAAIRELEPVIPPRAIPEPRPLELILVIDRSGSMTGAPMANARRAAIAAIRALRVDARVGGVAFSGSADAVLAPVPMALSAHMISFASGLQAGGGTDIGAALQAARGLITADPRYLHHVILMSDGESSPGPALAAAQSIAQAGASITAITLGPRNQLMADIARIGRGRYHVTQAATSLPALFVREAQYHLPPPSREVRFRPSIVRRPTWMDGIDPSMDPQMLGYVLAEQRPNADLVLAAPDGNPILAHWFFGNGQVATFTSATSGRWANEWRVSNGFRRMWTQMAWDMLRQRPDDALEIHVDRDPRRPALQRVSVVTTSVRAEPVPIATIWGGRELSAPLPLRPRAPGVWEAAVALQTNFVVDARLPATPEPTVAAGLDAPYDMRWSSFGSEPNALASLASAGGGRVLTDPATILRDIPVVRVPRDLRTPLIALALLIYLLGALLLRMPTGYTGGEVPVQKPRASRTERPSADRRSRPPADSVDRAA